MPHISFQHSEFGQSFRVTGFCFVLLVNEAPEQYQFSMPDPAYLMSPQPLAVAA